MMLLMTMVIDKNDCGDGDGDIDDDGDIYDYDLFSLLHVC
jgi:hypothetical protein